MKARTWILLLLTLVLAPTARAETGLNVEIGLSRSRDENLWRADQVANAYARQVHALTKWPMDLQCRALGRPNLGFAAPVTIHLMVNGRRLGSPPGRDGENISIAFDDSGPGSFPLAYRQLLESVYSTALPTIRAIFGNPSWSGAVRVSNFDAEIGDRQAVTGGYFVPNNGQGQAEIRFPIYNSPEAAAVNFVHCLCLAFMGSKAYPFDAYNEGIVRAATMRIARAPGAMPASLDPALIEAVLENSYDVGTFYDWYNQPALSGPAFIAPNLLAAPLPIGGSLGGIYLTRFQMAGTAWQKVLVEYPAFAATFNALYYANPSLYQTAAALEGLAQTVLNSLAGPNATIEGQAFGIWARRQCILDVQTSYGLKLHCQAFPVVSGLGGNDFGVFAVQATWFETLLTGDEVLLSSTAFPIFWTPEFFRLFTSSQDEQMDITGAYGAVVPNFPGDQFNGQPYRVAVDLPVQDQLARIYLPAGAVATAQNPTPNDLYGSVIGIIPELGVQHVVRVSWPGGSFPDLPVVNFAFGGRAPDPEFLGSRLLTVELIRVVGGAETVLLSRRVNKGPGPLALDLNLEEEIVYTLPQTLPAGISAFGLPIQAWRPHPTAVLGLNAADILLGRWNPAKARYDLFPSCESFRIGHGYFVRLQQPMAGLTVVGSRPANTPTAVALRPGWNLITPPVTTTATTNDVQVIVGRDSPRAWFDAVGSVLGSEFFTFQPGAPDPVSKVPETGVMVPATAFEPGRAYYVRVLSSEGATLLFTNTFRSRQMLGRPSGKRKPSGWSLNLELSDGRTKALAVIGQTRSGTRGFDPREDSGMPPSMGGLAVTSRGSEPLFKDVRRLGRQEAYRVQMEHLRKGALYVFRARRGHGTPGSFSITDPQTGRKIRYIGSGSYAFVATGPKHEVIVEAPAK